MGRQFPSQNRPRQFVPSFSEIILSMRISRHALACACPVVFWDAAGQLFDQAGHSRARFLGSRRRGTVWSKRATLDVHSSYRGGHSPTGQRASIIPHRGKRPPTRGSSRFSMTPARPALSISGMRGHKVAPSMWSHDVEGRTPDYVIVLATVRCIFFDTDISVPANAFLYAEFTVNLHGRISTKNFRAGLRRST